MRYSARQLAIILGVQPSTITRDIKKGRLSASRDDKGEYVIEASEIARAYSDRVTVDVAGNVAAKEQTQSDATGDATVATAPATDTTAVLTARLEAAERLLAEREQTIEDLRRRLDSEFALRLRGGSQPPRLLLAVCRTQADFGRNAQCSEYFERYIAIIIRITAVV